VATGEIAIEQNKPSAALVGSLTRGRRSKWWRRRGTKGRGFYYETADGRRITDPDALERIRALVIPPAWSHVKISPSAGGRLQAVGVDTAGRVQRLYHPTFVARQQRRKFEKIERFGQSLPSLRRQANDDIEREGLSRERVLAVVVRLINDLYFRLGSEESVQRYRTFGVTTLRSRHLEIKRGGRLCFEFVGKSHVKHRLVLVDDELAALMREIKAIRGARLFKYYDEAGRVRAITARDVNEYIKAATANEFSAKDFRTWGGTLLTAIALAELGCCDNQKQAQRNIVNAVKRVAEHLGNTPTICRTSYVHPAVFESYIKGRTLEEFRPRRMRRVTRRQPEYEIEEFALLKLLAATKNGS
jgi:DNA topoisomerase-1